MSWPTARAGARRFGRGAGKAKPSWRTQIRRRPKLRRPSSTGSFVAADRRGASAHNPTAASSRDAEGKVMTKSPAMRQLGARLGARHGGAAGAGRADCRPKLASIGPAPHFEFCRPARDPSFVPEMPNVGKAESLGAWLPPRLLSCASSPVPTTAQHDQHGPVLRSQEAGAGPAQGRQSPWPPQLGPSEPRVDRNVEGFDGTPSSQLPRAKGLAHSREDDASQARGARRQEQARGAHQGL